MGIVGIDTVVDLGAREEEVVAEGRWVSWGNDDILYSNGILGRKGWKERERGCG